jgi:Archaeal fructose-1,6-bisphosphatase and related enzymes of inositol monophosphatase family
MKHHIPQIKEIMREAGKIMTASHVTTSDITVKNGDDNFVTAYDIAVQEFLISKLSALIPEADFLAEESGVTAVKSDMFFIIDPIDGTTNFIHGYNHSAISVALCKDGAPVFGAVYNPYLNELFHAYEGEGAFVDTADTSDGNAVATTKITVSDRALSDSLVCFGTSPYSKFRADETFDIVKKLFISSRDVRRSGSAALDICYVAGGRCDLFYEATLSPWDYAAGWLIVREAGGALTCVDGSDVSFTSESSVIAGNNRARADFMRL